MSNTAHSESNCRCRYRTAALAHASDRISRPAIIVDGLLPVELALWVGGLMRVRTCNGSKIADLAEHPPEARARHLAAICPAAVSQRLKRAAFKNSMILGDLIVTLSHLCNFVVSCVAASLVATAAIAQASDNYRSIEATPGKPAQLSYHAFANKNCTAGSPPTVRVIEAPKSGTLMVRQGTFTTNKVVGCPTIKTPARVIFYQARDGYAGPDHVKYEVTSENGDVDTYDIAITVKPGAAPAKPPEATTGVRSL